MVSRLYEKNVLYCPNPPSCGCPTYNLPHTASLTTGYLAYDGFSSALIYFLQQYLSK